MNYVKLITHLFRYITGICSIQLFNTVASPMGPATISAVWQELDRAVAVSEACPSNTAEKHKNMSKGNVAQSVENSLPKTHE